MAETGILRAPQPPENTAGKRALLHSGTDRANIDTIPSTGSIPGKHGWGGARNSALRTSYYLTAGQCLGLLAAADHAEKIGLPFNRHWTVHYEKAGISEADATRFIRRLLKLANDYARRHGGRLAAIWCRESGEGKGGHVHIILHLPADLPLAGKTRRWVRYAGGKCRRGVSVVRSIAGSLNAAEHGGAHYQHNAAIVRLYVMKGANREAGEALGLDRFGVGGLIIGKRCGTTENIGKAARKDGLICAG